MLESIDLLLGILVSLHNVTVTKSEVVLLLTGHHQLVVSVPQSSLSFEDLLLEFSVSSVLALRLSLEVSFLSQLAVKISLKGLRFDHQARVIFFRPSKLIS